MSTTVATKKNVDVQYLVLHRQNHYPHDSKEHLTLEAQLKPLGLSLNLVEELKLFDNLGVPMVLLPNIDLSIEENQLVNDLRYHSILDDNHFEFLKHILLVLNLPTAMYIP